MTIAAGPAERRAIGQAMQAWRAANALTREQVAVHLGCSWATIRGYELGKREPLISIVLLLEKWHPGLIKAIGKEKR